MIIDTIKNASKYFAVHPLFAKHLNILIKPILQMQLMVNRIYPMD